MASSLQEVRRGRTLLLIAFAVTLLGDMCVITLKIARLGIVPASIGSVFSWFITVGLFYAIWRGHRWVRWLMVGLFGWGLLLLLPRLISSLHPLAIGIALQFSITIALLVFSPSVSAFIDYQRSKYREDAQPPERDELRNDN